MRVGILGGAFDPITLGHLDVCEFVLRHTKMDRIWITPCFDHPFSKKMAPYLLRLRMIQLSISHRDPRITWATYERDQKLSGETWKTLQSLGRKKCHKQDSFYWIIGTDEANVIDKWANVDWLKAKAKFIIVPRQGCIKVDPKSWIFKSPNIDLSSKGEVGDTSSTEAREAVKKWDLRKLKKLVPNDIIGYIKTQEMYNVS